MTLASSGHQGGGAEGVGVSVAEQACAARALLLGEIVRLLEARSCE